MDEILEYIDTIDAVRLLAKFGETFKFISDVFVAEKKNNYIAFFWKW